MVNLVKFARAAPCTKPIMLFSVTAMMISFIFTTVIVTAGLQATSRNFYLVSFEYNLPTSTSSAHTRRAVNNGTMLGSATTTTAAATTTSSSATTNSNTTSSESSLSANMTTSQSDARDAFKSAVQTLLTADEINTNLTFGEVRVSYHGVCTLVSSDAANDDSWRCGDVKSTRSLAQMAGGDPMDLIDIGAYYKDKMAFSLPWWFSVGCLGLSTMALIVGSIPFIPISPYVNRVAAISGVLGSGSLLVGLLLAHVTSNAVATLTDLLTVDTVTAHIGHANQVFGWSAFALSFLSALGVSLVAGGELALLKAEQRSNRMIDHAVNKSVERIPFSSPMQHTGSASSKTGLGRTMGGVGMDDLKDLAKARTRQEALTTLAGKITTKREKGDNMV